MGHDPEQIQILDKRFERFLTSQDVQRAVERMAEEIGQVISPRTVMVCVLKGALHFASDLLRYLPVDIPIIFVDAASYKGVSRTDDLQMDLGEADLHGQEVLLVEDIVDSGHTVEALRSGLMHAGCTRLLVASLLHKPEAQVAGSPPDFIGFSVLNDFVVGYGMDYHELGRGYRSVYRLMEDSNP